MRLYATKSQPRTQEGANSRAIIGDSVYPRILTGESAGSNGVRTEPIGAHNYSKAQRTDRRDHGVQDRQSTAKATGVRCLVLGGGNVVFSR